MEAVKWHHKAAEQELAQAQGNLGALYEYGYGIRQDFIRAHMWYSIDAIRLSEDDGKTVMKLRDSVASQVTAAQIGKAEEMARRCQQYVFKICD